MAIGWLPSDASFGPLGWTAISARAINGLPGASTLPVVVLTAKGEAVRDGIDGTSVLAVLEKPFDPMTLPDRLREVLVRA
mgnify:CR=1 FL=1